jgi:hypothetical protein
MLVYINIGEKHLLPAPLSVAIISVNLIDVHAVNDGLSEALERLGQVLAMPP